MAVLGIEAATAAELSRLRIAYNQLVKEHGVLTIRYAELREEAAANACSMHYADMQTLKRLCGIILSSSDANAAAMLQELAWRDERIQTCLRELQES